MPVVSRIDWVSRQLQMGRSGHVVVGPALDPAKLKIRIVLQPPSVGALSPTARLGVQAVLAHVRQMAFQNVSVDRGHRFSSGQSEISIWIQLGANVQGSNSIASADQLVDNHDGDRRHRGRSPRSPDRGSDPWHSGGGDPWSRLEDVRPNKQARRHQQRSLHNPIDNSTTPDPPALAHQRNKWFDATRIYLDSLLAAPPDTTAIVPPPYSTLDVDADPLSANSELDNEDSTSKSTTNSSCLKIFNPNSPQWQRLPEAHWRRMYSKFDGYRSVMGALHEKSVKAQWTANPSNIPDGTTVSMHYGINKRTGKILRRGHGPYQNRYRVYDDADGTDLWVDCWRCCPV